MATKKKAKPETVTQSVQRVLEKELDRLKEEHQKMSLVAETMYDDMANLDEAIHNLEETLSNLSEI